MQHTSYTVEAILPWPPTPTTCVYVYINIKDEDHTSIHLHTCSLYEVQGGLFNGEGGGGIE